MSVTLPTLTLVSTRKEKPIESLTMHFDALPPEAEVLTRELIATALNQLTYIASLYTRYDDPLSRRLHLWCKDVITEFDPNQKLNNDYIEDVAARIHELTHEILVNGLDFTTLVDPIIVNDELPVWEKTHWEEYQQVLNLSPQTGRVHEFAADMLAWRASIPIAELNPAIQMKHALFQPLQKLVVNTPQIRMDETPSRSLSRAILYTTQRALAIDSNHEIETQEHFNKEIITCRKIWEQAQSHIAQTTEEIRIREQQHTAMINQTIADMQNSYRQNLANMKSSYQLELDTKEATFRREAQILTQHLSALQGQLRTEIARSGANEQLVAQQARELSSLRGTFANLAAQNAANNRAAHRRRGCIIS